MPKVDISANFGSVKKTCFTLSPTKEMVVIFVPSG